MQASPPKLEEGLVTPSLRDRVAAAYKKRLLFSSHAVEQMNLSERLITAGEVRDIIEEGMIIEEYTDDRRGPSCLLYGKTREGRVLHVVCAPKRDHLVVVTPVEGRTLSGRPGRYYTRDAVVPLKVHQRP